VITKSGAVYAEKRASLLLTLPGLHIAQNVLAKSQLRSQFLHRKLLEAFRSQNVSGSKYFGAQSAALPEMAIAERQFVDGGKRFYSFLARQGIQPDELTKRDLVVIRRALRGNFEEALQANNPRKEQLLRAVMSSVSDDVGAVTPHILRKGRKPIKDLEGVWKENPLTGRLLKGVGDEMGSLKDVTPSTKLQRAARGATTTGVTGGIAYADPTTAMVNVTKRSLASPLVKKAPLVGKAQDEVNKRMVTNPMKKSFSRGLEGQKEAPAGWSSSARDYLFNPVLNQMRNLSQGVGRVAHGAGITKKQLQDAQKALPPKSTLSGS